MISQVPSRTKEFIRLSRAFFGEVFSYREGHLKFKVFRCRRKQGNLLRRLDENLVKELVNKGQHEHLLG